MSGIIGQVGAKSGIISSGGSASAGTVTLAGTTGLDYEEGTWTPTYSNASAATSGSYKKIGKKVFIEGWIYADGGASGAEFGGLPFSGVATGNAAGGGVTHYQNNTSSGNQYGIQISSLVFYFYNDATQVNFASTKQSGFSFNYTIA